MVSRTRSLGLRRVGRRVECLVECMCVSIRSCVLDPIFLGIKATLLIKIPQNVGCKPGHVASQATQ